MAILEEFRPLVIDNGTRMIKAGFAGDDCPKVILPNLVGRRPKNASTNGSDLEDVYIKYQDLPRRDLRWNYPMENGIVTDWDTMVKVWHHMFNNELRVSPKGCTILLTEPVLNPKENRMKMTQHMFETFGVAKMYVAISPLLTLMASGIETGVVLDSGGGVTQVVPVKEGSILPHAMCRLDFAGSDLTRVMANLLDQKGYFFNGSADLNVVSHIKETLGYVALDYNNEIEIEKSYNLPDGQILTIGRERFECSEVLFKPVLIGIQEKGIHKAIYESISKFGSTLQNDLYGNIVISGGSTKFPGFAERLKKEMEACRRPTKVNVIPERENSVFIGGSIVAVASTFQEEWITKAEYDEYGSIIAVHKCV